MPREKMFTTFRFEKRIEYSEKAKILRDAYLALPDSNPSASRELEAVIEARARLSAARELADDAEKAMSEYMAALRRAILKDWKPSEIPEEIKSVFTVF